MKRYVQNIERLFAGQTANALVLSQVDEDFPVLIPSIGEEDDVQRIPAFVDKWRRTYPDFDPPGPIDDVAALNSYIVDFNLGLQDKFKSKAHEELYMMDDTYAMKPDQDTSYGSERTYVHCLNGIDQESGDNSSQLNVLFPFRKLMQKSLFQRVSSIVPETQLDQMMEMSRIATLQGRCSYRDSVKQVVQAGNNLYVLSPTISIGGSPEMFSNNDTVMLNGVQIPTNISLFQPSQDQFNSFNIAAEDEDNPLSEFLEWYEMHDGKTWMHMTSVQGGNISTLRLYGADRAYGLDLATYGPTDLMARTESGQEVLSSLSAKGLQNLRAGEGNGRYIAQTQTYILDNVGKSGEEGEVGFRFNLYDNFITGSERTIKMDIPRSKDFNNLVLKFQWSAHLDEELVGDMEYVIEVNAGQAKVDRRFREDGLENIGDIYLILHDAAVDDSEVQITVRMFYDVDYVRRNHSIDYRARLAESGVTLWNIKVEDQASYATQQPHLTFGTYVNEWGIGEEDFQRRWLQFWRVSKLIQNAAFQSVIETSVRNVQTNGIVNRNNYQTGDMSGDMFLTKNMLNSCYDMQMSPYEQGGETFLKMAGRDYINLLSCSNQLALVWRGSEMKMSSDSQMSCVPESESELKYQMVETVRNINRFESSIKHKPNVFSVVVENSNLAPDDSDSRDERLEDFKRQLRNSVSQFVRNACRDVAPVHTQLLDVQFS